MHIKKLKKVIHQRSTEGGSSSYEHIIITVILSSVNQS